MEINRVIGKSKKQIHPMLKFVLEFIRDIIVIAIVVVGLRVLHFLITWCTEIMPISHESHAVEPYIGIEMTRWLITVMDIVAMVSITMIGLYTIYKNSKELYHGIRSESCFTHCPHEDKFTKNNEKRE